MKKGWKKEGILKFSKMWTLILLTLTILPTFTKAATVGHSAPYISTGMFESGNYTFPDSLHIEKYLNVTNLLFVDPVTNMVGIGTTSPAYLLQVEGTINTTGLRTEGLTHLLGNVTMDDNLTVGGNTLYVEPISGRIGIGTSSPGATLEITNTTAADVLFNVSYGADGTDALIINRTGVAFNDSNLYIDTVNNRVGIGTAGPAYALEVNGLIASKGTSTGAYFVGTGTTSYNELYFQRGTTTVVGYIASGVTESVSTNGDYFVIENRLATGGIALRTNDASRIVALATGNVGIGTSTPGSKLEVIGDVNLTNGSLYAVQNDGNNETVTEMLTLEHLNASSDVGAGIGSGIMFRTSDNAGEVENISMIAGVMEDVGNASERGALVFYTGYGNQDGIISNLSSSETMRLDTEGLRVIGNLTVTGASYLGSMIFDNNATFGDSVNVSEDFEAGGVLFVDGRNGNVGIGTTTPGAKLDIYGSTLSVGTLAIPTTDTLNQVFIGNAMLASQQQADGQSDFGLNWYYNSGFKYRMSDEAANMQIENGNIRFQTAAAGAADAALTWLEKLTILNDGSVGIGTNAPGYLLDVKGNVSLNNTLYVTEAGSVGINTTSPTESLDVDGNIKLSGYIDNGQKVYTRIYNVGGNATDNATLLDSTGAELPKEKAYLVEAYIEATSSRTGAKAIIWNDINNETYLTKIYEAGTNLTYSNHVQFYIDYTDSSHNYTCIKLYDHPNIYRVRVKITEASDGYIVRSPYAFDGGVIYQTANAGNTQTGTPSGGSVGIGTTDPTHAFSVQGTMNVTRAAGAAAGIEVDANGNVIIRLG